MFLFTIIGIVGMNSQQKIETMANGETVVITVN